MICQVCSKDMGPCILDTFIHFEETELDKLKREAFAALWVTIGLVMSMDELLKAAQDMLTHVKETEDKLAYLTCRILDVYRGF